MITPASIKNKFPEFASIDDATIQNYIDDAGFAFSPTAWAGTLSTGATLIDLGMSYYVAAQIFNYVVQVDDTTQAAPYSSKSAGQASVSLAVSAIDAKDPDALFMNNKYGQYYLSLRNSLGLGMTSSALVEGVIFPI